MTRFCVSNGFRIFLFDMMRLGSQISRPLPHYSFLPLLKKLSLTSKPYCLQRRHFAGDEKRVEPESRVATLDAFSETEQKNKDSYLELLHLYKSRDVRRRGHVEFIYAALKHMKEFGVSKDLEAYKSLMDVMPKGKFIAQNILQAEFQHYPKQQQCIIDLLEQMEINAVCPDEEMEDVLTNLFGGRSIAIRRYWRMMYWMPKMKNLSPWPVPDPVPEDSLELAKLAIKRITSVDPSTEVSVFQTTDVKDSIDNTWIVSGQSSLQKELITKLDKTLPLFVEGSFRVWLKGNSVNYFILRGDPDPTPRIKPDPDDISDLKLPLFEQPTQTKAARSTVVHEQEDGTILAVCASGSSSRDSLLSWVRLLQRDNPGLDEVPVLFTLKSPLGSTEPLTELEGDDPVPTVVTDTTQPPS